VRLIAVAIAFALSVVPTANAAAQNPRDTKQPERRHASAPPAAASCLRHAPIGFFTQPEVLGELGQAYANCYPQPVCASPTELETIQIDGYTDPSKWLWSGLSTSTFSIAQQDTIIAAAINQANAVTPTGKKILNIAFFRSVIVGNDPVYYFIYCTVTFGRCASPQKGMTWIHTASNAQTGTITVGCGGCDPYHGDTACTQLQPLLCIYKAAPLFPLPTGVSNTDQYFLWSGGVVATTQPMAGNAFANANAANSFCSAQFGAGWRVAEFHDGWGWNFQAYGGTVSAPAVPSTHFWVYINDQAAANCW